MTGMFAISLAGHDKNQIYVIIKEESEYVYLADGNLKPLEKPKKKKKKHIQLIKKGLDEDLLKKLQNGQFIYNEEIKYALKSISKSEPNKEETHVKG